MKQFLVLLLVLFSFFEVQANRTFTVDYENNCFLKDGKPFRYVSGSLHYFRVPQTYWKDRMIKMKAAGLNALQTYVEWSSHETEPGVYNFSGKNDIVKFLQTAQEVGLLVIFRPGPYICAERDLGGLPYWLMREKPNISLRSSDPVYLKYVDKWFSVLLQLVCPLLYENGGPIITVQVENEYGQFSCDFEYMVHMRDLIKAHLGDNVILFKTDIPGMPYYKCDNIDGVLTTADFGSGQNVTNAFETIRLFREAGPLIVTEYYPGWMDHWGDPHSHVNIDAVCKTLDEILAANASVNFYMFHGGTNFGFSNGANGPYVPQPTSYDYGAPLSEAGDPVDSYFKIRNVIQKYMPVPPNPPQPSSKLSFGPIQLKFVASLLDVAVSNTIYSKYPKTFEEISQAHGLCAYSVLVDFIPTDPALLSIPGLHDRGYVFVEEEFRGILSRQQNALSLPLQVLRGQKITIIVESQGRINSGSLDFKGLTSNVTLGGKILTEYVIQQIPLNDTHLLHSLTKHSLNKLHQEVSIKLPGIFSANFTLPSGTKVLDTFLDPRGWHKGVVFINGFNLGRYWPVMGPQVTLYVPATVLNSYPKQNNLTVVEFESAPCGVQSDPKVCSIKFLDTPILNGNTPKLQIKHFSKFQDI